MTNLIATNPTAALPTIERDLAERRAAAHDHRLLAGLRTHAARIARPALRRLAPRLAGAA